MKVVQHWLELVSKRRQCLISSLNALTANQRPGNPLLEATSDVERRVTRTRNWSRISRIEMETMADRLLGNSVACGRPMRRSALPDTYAEPCPAFEIITPLLSIFINSDDFLSDHRAHLHNVVPPF